MKSKIWNRPLLLVFLLSAISASSCATDRKRLAAAEAAKAEQSAIGQAIEIGSRKQPLPAQPEQCKGPVKSGVKDTDRVDVALLKQDAAISRANAILAACSDFYRKVQGHYGGR